MAIFIWDYSRELLIVTVEKLNLIHDHGLPMIPPL